MAKTRIGLHLIAAFKARTKPKTYGVIVEFDRRFPGGTARARLQFLSAYKRAKQIEVPDSIPAQYMPQIASLGPIDDGNLVAVFTKDDAIDVAKSMWTDNYVFGRLTRDSIFALANIRLPKGGPWLIYKIWQDLPIERFVYTSRRTVKCDAAGASFAASGKDIVWAVADTGIDGRHQHFRTLKTLDLPGGLRHYDFTTAHDDEDAAEKAALVDTDGHGTHVAGIIAGLSRSEPDLEAEGACRISSVQVQPDIREGQDDGEQPLPFADAIFGTAPDCKLLSLKVLQKSKGGELSSLLAAIGYVLKANDNGRHLQIHGLNLSIGYLFNPERYGAGQSPLCVEVDRLVRSGVCVVVAAGNGGYGTVSTFSGQSERAAHFCTISDPGNAALAITVGSTHREMPHTYGVSFFSAKGPTADGRMKPDLVAPGERIVSCAISTDQSLEAGIALFRIDSGTSMAAPHVSGAIAAFLSVRNEFKGKPEIVKDIFIRAATDLKRRPEFQGAGLLDLMRALQAV